MAEPMTPEDRARLIVDEAVMTDYLGAKARRAAAVIAAAIERQASELPHRDCAPAHPGRCCACNLPWPCPGERERRALLAAGVPAGEIGGQT